jgi:hypothetical protein
MAWMLGVVFCMFSLVRCFAACARVDLCGSIIWDVWEGLIAELCACNGNARCVKTHRSAAYWHAEVVAVKCRR